MHYVGQNDYMIKVIYKALVLNEVVYVQVDVAYYSTLMVLS